MKGYMGKNPVMVTVTSTGFNPVNRQELASKAIIPPDDLSVSQSSDFILYFNASVDIKTGYTVQVDGITYTVDDMAEQAFNGNTGLKSVKLRKP